MRSVAVIGRKGGSGKTTIAVHLALGFHLRGRRTVLADADPQRSSMEVLKGRQAGGPEAVATAGPKLFALKTSAMRAGAEALVIDTPAVLEEEVAHAVVLADLALLVVRPTFLDLAAAAHTADIIRRLRRPGLVVLNQAPVARESVEPPLVKRSIEALRLLRLPVAPVVIRARAAYQTVLETGCSAEEQAAESVAAQEMAGFCAFVDRFVFGAARAEGPGERPAVPVVGAQAAE
jgi:chromosome partitioning protein